MTKSLSEARNTVSFGHITKAEYSEPGGLLTVLDPVLGRYVCVLCTRCGKPIMKGERFETQGGGWAHTIC